LKEPKLFTEVLDRCPLLNLEVFTRGSLVLRCCSLPFASIHSVALPAEKVMQELSNLLQGN